MKPAPFDYARPETLDEALDLLAEYGDDAAPLAGGLSLGPMLNLRLARPTVVVDLHRLGLTAITEGANSIDNSIDTGALVRQAYLKQRLADDLSVPLVAEALDHVGHYQTRARGTVGGSVAHADPSAELPLCLATLDGSLTLRSRGGERQVSANDFFDDALMTARRSDELLTSVHWPESSTRTGCAFDEFALRHGDFAIVAAAAVVSLDSNGCLMRCRIGFGGVEGRPHVVEFDQFAGERLTAEIVTGIVEHAVAALDPMEDHVADAAYRRALARTLAHRVVSRAVVRVAPAP